MFSPRSLVAADERDTKEDWVDEKPVKRYTVDSKPMRPDDLRHLRRQSAAIPTVARWNSAR
jgi:hypothetical protein